MGKANPGITPEEGTPCNNAPHSSIAVAWESGSTGWQPSPLRQSPASLSGRQLLRRRSRPSSS